MPGATPVTTPVTDTVATPVASLLQVPPVTDSPNVVVAAEQKITGVDGVRAAGAAMTVTIVVAEQLPSEYAMVAVPAATPLTIPPDVTVAMLVALLLHVPPVTASVSVIVVPVQTADEDGEMAAAPDITVTVLIAKQLPIA